MSEIPQGEIPSVDKSSLMSGLLQGVRTSATYLRGQLEARLPDSTGEEQRVAITDDLEFDNNPVDPSEAMILRRLGDKRVLIGATTVAAALGIAQYIHVRRQKD